MRTILAWLSRRFPVQVVVTQSDYLRMEAGLGDLSNSLVTLNQRLSALEIQVRRLNESQGFNPLVKGPMRLER